MQRISHLLGLLRVPHRCLEAVGVTLVALLSSEEEADIALVGGGVPVVVEHHHAIHAGPSVGTPLDKKHKTQPYSGATPYCCTPDPYSAGENTTFYIVRSYSTSGPYDDIFLSTPSLYSTSTHDTLSH